MTLQEIRSESECPVLNSHMSNFQHVCVKLCRLWLDWKQNKPMYFCRQAFMLQFLSLSCFCVIGGSLNKTKSRHKSFKYWVRQWLNMCLVFWAPLIFGIGVFHQNSLSNVSSITHIIPGSYHKNRKCWCLMAYSLWIISKMMIILISIECAIDVCNCHNDWKLNPTTISEPCVGWWNNAISWSRRDGMDSTVIFTFLSFSS